MTAARLEIIRMALDRHEDDDAAIALAERLFPLVEVGHTASPSTAAAPVENLDLSPSERLVWRALAIKISETGLSPSLAAVARAAGVGEKYTRNVIINLVQRRFISREGGATNTVVYQVIQWPEGVTPRRAVGRMTAAQLGRPATPAKSPPRPEMSLVDVLRPPHRVGRPVPFSSDPQRGSA